MDGQPLPIAREVVYPESDGQPMESEVHRQEMTDYFIQVLDDHFANRPDVHISGNSFIYWVEGDPSRCVGPDGYVAFGIDKRLRPLLKVWEEGAGPAFVLEITSKTSKLHDQGEKMAIYRDELKVPEYFLFDPSGEWIPERLRGYFLAGELYTLVPRLPSGRLSSEVLGLEVGVAGGHLRFYLPGAAEPLPTRAERAAAATRRAEAEARKRAAQAKRADAQAKRAGAQAKRADAAEAETARLKAEIERLRRGPAGR